MRPPRRHKPDPLDNPLVAMLVHLVATLSLFIGAYWAADDDSLVPLGVAVVFVTALELAWWHKLFRR